MRKSSRHLVVIGAARGGTPHRAEADFTVCGLNDGGPTNVGQSSTDRG
uniref:Uncharacterized protein n=1 Tax=Rhizophora mucronata TaxID=61149 RepID=A0A2P2JX65_RHIMU